MFMNMETNGSAKDSGPCKRIKQFEPYRTLGIRQQSYVDGLTTKLIKTKIPREDTSSLVELKRGVGYR